ncbi:hypothetical protein BGX28_005438 [Mortierella sp. GBA30]|nr:hypothetical protein BGX28_005438 [Mortierella sp. GBA30]
MRLPLNSQFADTLINNESLPLLMSSASTLIQSPSISWTSITPSRDSSPDMPAEPEPESLTATTGRRPMNRFLKKRSGSTYSRPGSKVPRTKSMAPFVPFSHSVSSIPTGDPMLAPYGTVDDNNMQCQDLVSSAFGTLIKRRRRVRQVKTKVKLTSFACDSPGCGKVFSRAYNLTSHMKTHSAERPFLCDSCPLAFARRHDRERHVRLHTGEKPYSCESCGCGFMRNDALHRHQRICGQSAAALMALLQQQQKQYQSDVKLETATAGEEIH